MKSEKAAVCVKRTALAVSMGYALFKDPNWDWKTMNVATDVDLADKIDQGLLASNNFNLKYKGSGSTDDAASFVCAAEPMNTTAVAH